MSDFDNFFFNINVYSNDFQILFRSLFYSFYNLILILKKKGGGRRGRNRMAVGFTTTYTISAYHH
jgi:hypothetical protein